MERNAEILANFEDALEIHKEKRGSIQFYIPFDDVKIIANALKLAQTPSDEACAGNSRKSDFADTVEGMLSPDYKERFKAEYYQTKIRYERLKKFNTRIEAAGRTDYKPDGVRVPMPKHDCPDDLLIHQQRAMGEYLHILEVRAVIEGIDL